MASKTGPIESEVARKRFGSFLSRAASALGEVKDAVVRSSQIGKIKIDTVFLLRERERLVQDLGERVFLLVEEGKLVLSEEEEPILEALRAFQGRLDEQDEELAAVEAEADLRREEAKAAAARAAEEWAATQRAEAEAAADEASHTHGAEPGPAGAPVATRAEAESSRAQAEEMAPPPEEVTAPFPIAEAEGPAGKEAEAEQPVTEAAVNAMEPQGHGGQNPPDEKNGGSGMPLTEAAVNAMEPPGHGGHASSDSDEKNGGSGK